MRLTYEALRTMVGSRLSSPAFAHSERVADTAAWLAGIYGVDVEDARTAGLLHDWHRETDRTELERHARDAGVAVTDVDAAVPYLLHGPLAAADLGRDVPGLSEEVLDAIAKHTYGGSEMTPLAMVVYLADVIEPDRDHKGVQGLRDDVGAVGLGELFARAYKASVRHVVKTRRHIHPETVATWNRYVAEDRQ